MIELLTPLLVVLLLGGDPSHQQANPVFDELLEQGVAVSSDVSRPLPPPTMADGLGEAAQQAIIAEVAGTDYTPDQLLRKSVVSRHVLHLEHLVDQQAPTRRADTWFIAYGDLDAISDKEFLDQLLDSSSGDDEIGDQGHTLTADELSARGIAVDQASVEHESFANGSYRLIKKVEVQGTLHSYWSRTPDSIVFAGLLDPRFNDDEEFPNLWRTLERGTTGKLQLGPARPYQGTGFYLKITRLVQPAGALFVEAHLLLSEPHAWFDGANLLGSKLPAVVQNRVRATRREFLRASR